MAPPITYIYHLSLHDALPISKHGKNLIGAFYRPKAVIYDLDFLKSLQSSEVLSGFGEVFKHARSEEHTSELQSRFDLVCRLLLEKNNPNFLKIPLLQYSHMQI